MKKRKHDKKKRMLEELRVSANRATLRRRNRQILNEVTAVAAILEADSWEISDPHTEAYTNFGEVHRLDKRHIERICSKERRVRDMEKKISIRISEETELIMDRQVLRDVGLLTPDME